MQEPCLCCSRLEPQCPEEEMIFSGCSKNIWKRNTEGEDGRAEREMRGRRKEGLAILRAHELHRTISHASTQEMI